QPRHPRLGRGCRDSHVRPEEAKSLRGRGERTAGRMTRHHLAAELASRVAGTFATDTMPDRLAADDTLMDLAKADMNAAAEAVINLDRKSTRLNSSHVKISYAVFCLKK